MTEIQREAHAAISNILGNEDLRAISEQPHGYRYGVEERDGKLVFVHGFEIGNEIAEYERPIVYAAVRGDPLIDSILSDENPNGKKMYESTPSAYWADGDFSYYIENLIEKLIEGASPNELTRIATFA
jgi:hypothetical protein